MSGAALVSAADELRAAMAAQGIVPTGRLIPDGKLRRVHVEGDRRGVRDGWYVLHPDGIPAGAFGHWRLYPGQSFTWRADGWKDADPAERAEAARKIEAERTKREAAERAATERAAARARRVWDEAEPADARHPYLVRKGIGAHGIRQSGDLLLVPVRDTTGEIHGLQSIDADGAKRFKSGTAKLGNYHAIGRLRGVLVIAEGFATGATIHDATGHAVAVAFDCGNLHPVAVALHSKYPTADFVVAADNDHRTPGNPGLSAARVAARAVGGRVLVPEFRAGEPGTDWNDYAAAHGLDAVRAHFSEPHRRAA